MFPFLITLNKVYHQLVNHGLTWAYMGYNGKKYASQPHFMGLAKRIQLRVAEVLKKDILDSIKHKKHSQKRNCGAQDN
jgi:hypothetical protein